VLVLLTLAVSACGPGDDGTASFEPPPTTPVVGEGLPPEVRHPAVKAIDRLQRAFAERDYAGFCAWMTPSAAREAGKAAHGEATTCERDVRRLFGLIREGGGWRRVNAPRVIAVKTHGDTATATMALDRRWRAQIALARRDGRWRLNGLFGAPVGPALRLAERTADTDFPPAEGAGAVEAKDGDGTPCPDLSETDFPAIDGGCRIRMAGRITPLTMLTPFGDFKFDRCSIAYRVRVDASGRTWTEDFDVEGDSKSVACGDVNACYDFDTEELVPWRGRIYPDGDGFVHRMDMCLRTCVGYFVGRLNMRLVRDADGWRAVPINGGGDTGFRFDSPLVVKGDLDLDAGT